MWCSKLKLKRQCPRCDVQKSKTKTLSQMWCSSVSSEQWYPVSNDDVMRRCPSPFIWGKRHNIFKKKGGGRSFFFYIFSQRPPQLKYAFFGHHFFTPCYPYSCAITRKARAVGGYTHTFGFCWPGGGGAPRRRVQREGGSGQRGGLWKGASSAVVFESPSQLKYALYGRRFFTSCYPYSCANTFKKGAGKRG